MKTNKYVIMEDVIGAMAHEHGIPILSFDKLVELGRKAVVVYGLGDKSKKISFDIMCTYIKMYITTPFGLRVLRELSHV